MDNLMKYIIFIANIIMPISMASAMNSAPSDLKIKKHYNDTYLIDTYIIIKNKLATSKSAINKKIIISDDNITASYQNKNYDPSKYKMTIAPNEHKAFFPHQDLMCPEKKRFGLNNTGDAALLNIEFAGTNDRIFLRVGKNYKVQFGDILHIYSINEVEIQRDNKFYPLNFISMNKPNR